MLARVGVAVLFLVCGVMFFGLCEARRGVVGVWSGWSGVRLVCWMESLVV